MSVWVEETSSTFRRAQVLHRIYYDPIYASKAKKWNMQVVLLGRFRPGGCAGHNGTLKQLCISIEL